MYFLTQVFLSYISIKLCFCEVLYICFFLLFTIFLPFHQLTGEIYLQERARNWEDPEKEKSLYFILHLYCCLLETAIQSICTVCIVTTSINNIVHFFGWILIQHACMHKRRQKCRLNERGVLTYWWSRWSTRATKSLKDFNTTLAFK